MNLHGWTVGLLSAGTALFVAGLVVGLTVPPESAMQALQPGADCAPPKTLLCRDAGGRVLAMLVGALWTAAVAMLVAGGVVYAKNPRGPRPDRSGGAVEATEGARASLASAPPTSPTPPAPAAALHPGHNQIRVRRPPS